MSNALKLHRIFLKNFELDSARKYIFLALKVARKPSETLKVYSKLNDFYDDIERNDSARYYAFKAIHLAEKQNKPEIQANKLTDLGRSFYVEGIYDSAMVYYLKALDVFKENKIISTKRGWLLHYIGSVFKRQELPDKACEYYEKELHYAKRYGFQDVEGDALYLNSWCISKDDPQKALEMRLVSLEIFKERKNRSMQSLLYDLIGASYKGRKEYQKALVYQYKALKIRQEERDLSKIAASFDNIAGIYLDLKQYDKAITYFVQAEAFALQTNRKRHIRLKDIYTGFAATYNEIGQYEKAYKYLKLKQSYSDSIISENRRKGVDELSEAYETVEQRHEIEMLKKDKELRELKIAQQNTDVEKEKETNKFKTTLNIALFGGILIILVAAISFFKRLKLSRNQNELIEKQKKEVDNKNREIIASIHYAKRIQKAILPSDAIFENILPNSFVYYRPKDIVAGDFYWLEPIINNEGHKIILLAAADCTGHGVPGAMVSVICHNGLNRSVREDGLTIPGSILDRTREIVIQEFEKSDDDVQDGMDIALVGIEYSEDIKEKKVVLNFAGAHNPLWVVRNLPSGKEGGEVAIEEIKANKQPIGKFANPEPYKTHKIELLKGDTFYIFSDGYADQFGGEKGKKFKTENFKKLLLEIQDCSMQEQKLRLENKFVSWSEGIEQVDDICVLGVKL